MLRNRALQELRAILFLLAITIGLSGIPLIPAYANHEVINIELQRPASGAYVHGDEIITHVNINTGNLGGHPIDTDGEVKYSVLFTDKLADHAEIPVRSTERVMFLSPFENKTLQFSRPFIEGYWLLTVDVYEDTRDGERLRTWQDTIVVQSELYPLIQQEANATRDAADATAHSAFWITVTAVATPAGAIGGTFLLVIFERRKHLKELEIRWQSKYHEHSIVMITAIKAWYDAARFPYFYYDNGRFLEQSLSYPETGLDEQVTDHMEKYVELNAALQEIQSDSVRITVRKKEIFQAQNKDSLDKIITEKMRSKFPSVHRESRDFGINAMGSNQYIDSHLLYYIYNEVVLKISGGSPGRVETNPLTSVPGSSIHEYEGHFIICADDTTIREFLTVVGELCSDVRIIALVKENLQLKKDLQEVHNDKIPGLRERLGRLYTYVINGGDLEGYPACDLCPKK